MLPRASKTRNYLKRPAGMKEPRQKELIRIQVALLHGEGIHQKIERLFVKKETSMHYTVSSELCQLAKTDHIKKSSINRRIALFDEKDIKNYGYYTVIPANRPPAEEIEKMVAQIKRDVEIKSHLLAKIMEALKQNVEQKQAEIQNIG
jgi:hypothetical protein